MTTSSDFGYADLLAHLALVDRDGIALAGAFEPVTHGELQRRATGLAAGLAEAGVVRGDRLALLAPNRPELFELLGACARLGATLVLLNTRAGAAETAALIDDVAPRSVVVDPGLQPLLADVDPAVPRCTLGDAGWARWCAAPAREFEAFGVAQASLPLVGIPTAAVGGRPRVALLSHASLLHQALLLAHAWRLGPADRHLCLLPLFHVAGLGMSLATQLAGGASVLMARFDATEAVQAIDRWRVSHFTSFTPILDGLLDAARDAGSNLASLRAITGLEPPPTVARLQVQCPQAVFWTGYGQTETAGLVCLSPAVDRPGSAGRPLPTVAMRIVQPDGRPAASGESGDIEVRGPFVFSGYWGSAPQAWRAGTPGWHRTGDLGRLDADGYLWFEGRAPDKSLIKSGGENIYPAEVEDALLAHPAIEAAVVLGVPDARWGEAVRAVCVCRPGQTVSEAALAEFVAARIARFKRPRDLVFVDALPRSADGGWDRAAVRAAHGG